MHQMFSRPSLRYLLITANHLQSMIVDDYKKVRNLDTLGKKISNRDVLSLVNHQMCQLLTIKFVSRIYYRVTLCKSQLPYIYYIYMKSIKIKNKKSNEN